MEQRKDKELSMLVEKVTCKRCGGRTDIPHDTEDLKAGTCEKDITNPAGCQPPL